MTLVDTYAELPPSLRKKLRTVPKSGTSVPAQEIPNASTAKGIAGLVPHAAKASVPSKLSQRPLTLSNPAKESDRTLQEKQKARLERKKQKIANKRRRSGRLVKSDLGLIPDGGLASSRPLLKGQANYDLLRPLHKLWLGYISELLNLALRLEDESIVSQSDSTKSSADGLAGLSSMSLRDISKPSSPATELQASGGASLQAFPLNQMQVWQGKLVKADFHGCHVEVTKAKQPSLVGLSGIVAQETEGTFRIVTRRNLVKVIPKANVTFGFSLPLTADQTGTLRDLRFELHGSNFAFRAADRASRKFKAKGAKGLDF